MLIEKVDFVHHLTDTAGYSLPNPIEDLELRGCTFSMFQHPTQRTLALRPTLRRVAMTRCRFTACELGPIVMEDSVIDTLWLHRGTWGYQQIVGCAFKHVVIRGMVSGLLRLIATPDWSPVRRAAPSLVEPWLEENAAYYEGVDWAVDISDAQFASEVSLTESGIPARLIRRDPASQVVLTRDGLRATDWEHALRDHSMRFAVERFLATPLPDAVLVASKRHRDYADSLKALSILRDIGAADAD